MHIIYLLQQIGELVCLGLYRACSQLNHSQYHAFHKVIDHKTNFCEYFYESMRLYWCKYALGLLVFLLNFFEYEESTLLNIVTKQW